jgi:methylene-tetrahydromethanopterin dehydrogenase
VKGLLAAADVNVVPPNGLESVEVMGDGAPFGAGKALAVGALAIGNVKCKTASGLFRPIADGRQTAGVRVPYAIKFALDIAS